LQGVTAQFLGNADTYHKKYLNYARIESPIKRALKQSPFDRDAPTILDIGSGSGNSVIPLLKLFPDSTIVACDISPNMLAILRDHLAESPEYSQRCLLIATNVMHDHFMPDKFDLTVGAAILHHILDVQKTLGSVYKALRNDGVAVFFEPFEAGNAILRMAYQHILERAHSTSFGNLITHET
jgi:ubiquinone/menaquinone biosynthesis C-methylase UbiE